MCTEDDYGHNVADELVQMLYVELRAAARHRMAGERSGHTLSATVLVHEAYLKLGGPRSVPWRNPAHFYAAAVVAMRQVLLDHARARASAKRGGGRARVNLDDVATLADAAEESSNYVALADAVSRLKKRDDRAAAVVELRFYAGLSVSETADVLSVSERTVKSDWAFAKAWLERELRAERHE